MRTFLVTGSNRGIGLELVKQLLKAGNKVIAGARYPAADGELKNLLSEHDGQLELAALDVTNSRTIDGLLYKLSGRSVDVLINNAAVATGYGESLLDVDLTEVMRTFNVNVIGSMRMVKAVSPVLKKSDNPLIANISSRVGSIADNESGYGYGYRISKAALNMFNKNISLELASDKISCVALHPGWVQTDMGGPGAMITPSESVSGLLKVIETLSMKDTGKFYNYKGEELPW